MRAIMTIASALVCLLTPAWGQIRFSDYVSYCEAMSEISTVTLVYRTQGMPRAGAEALMAEMTDPVAIRMVKEVTAFAYARPVNRSVNELRRELRDLCLQRKMFVQ